jgi:hypothetical protein
LSRSIGASLTGFVEGLVLMPNKSDVERIGHDNTEEKCI